jgi:hypothetical protein
VRLSTQKKITTTFVATALIALASCSTTIVGSTDTSAPAKVDVTTTLPVGTVKELLTNIIQATRGLGDAVASGDNKTAQSRLGDVLANWQVLKPMLKDSSLDIAADIEARVLAVACSQRTLRTNGGCCGVQRTSKCSKICLGS